MSITISQSTFKMGSSLLHPQQYWPAPMFTNWNTAAKCFTSKPIYVRQHSTQRSQALTKWVTSPLGLCICRALIII